MKISRFSLLGSRFLAADTATAGGEPAAAPASQVEPAAPAAPAAPAPAAPAEPAPAAPAAPAPAAPAEPAPAAQAAAPKKLTIFDRASTFLQDRASLVKQISGLSATVAAHVATIAQRDQTISAQAAELAELRAGRDQLTSTVATLETAATTVAAGVVDAMAQIGVPAASLPQSQNEDATDDALLEKYESLKGADKTAFFRANRVALKRAAGARDSAAKK